MRCGQQSMFAENSRCTLYRTPVFQHEDQATIGCVSRSCHRRNFSYLSTVSYLEQAVAKGNSFSGKSIHPLQTAVPLHRSVCTDVLNLDFLAH